MPGCGQAPLKASVVANTCWSLTRHRERAAELKHSRSLCEGLAPIAPVSAVGWLGRGGPGTGRGAAGLVHSRGLC